MSINVSNYVWDLTFGNATRKLVLLRFADHAHDDGTASWCGIPKVAKFAECDERTVKRHVKWLYEHGYLTEGDQELVAHYPKNKRPIVYNISLSDAQRAEWEVLNASGGATRRERATAAGFKGSEQRAANKAAAEAANGQVSGGDNLSPQEVASTPVVGGDNLSPQVGGDTGGQLGVTDEPIGGDTGVTQTTLETTPGNHPSSSAEPITAEPTSPAALVAAPSPDGSGKKEPRATRIPADFATTGVSAEMVEWARTECPDVDGRVETANFIDYWNSKGGKDARKTDWKRTWQVWFRTAQQRHTERTKARGKSYSNVDTWGTQPGGAEPMTKAEADKLFGLAGDTDAASAADAG